MFTRCAAPGITTSSASAASVTTRRARSSRWTTRWSSWPRRWVTTVSASVSWRPRHPPFPRYRRGTPDPRKRLALIMLLRGRHHVMSCGPYKSTDGAIDLGIAQTYVSVRQRRGARRPGDAPPRSSSRVWRQKPLARCGHVATPASHCGVRSDDGRHEYRVVGCCHPSAGVTEPTAPARDLERARRRRSHHAWARDGASL